MKLELFINECKEKREDIDEYDLSHNEDNIDSQSKIKILHKTCNRYFYMKCSNFRNGKQRCSLCYGNKYKINFDVAKNAINSEKDFKLVSEEYINGTSPLKVLHESKNHIFEVSYSAWAHKNVRCKICANNMRLNPIDMANNIKKFDENYFSNDYSAKNAHSKIKIVHTTCGREFYMQYNNFKYGQRCPYCASSNASKNISKNAEKIIHRLEEYNIKIELEKSFSDLLSKYSNKKLRYDIYIPDKNLIIEYQGEQHFKYYKKGRFTYDNFIKIQERDKQKLEYANENNINIEFITCYENIDETLNKIIEKYKIEKI